MNLQYFSCLLILNIVENILIKALKERVGME